MLNNRLNAFDPTISPICTFCKILDRDTRHRDGHAHFFMECAITSRLLNVWGSKFEPQVSLINPGFFSLYWYGIPPAGGGEQILLNLLTAESFRYVLWKYKIRRKIPNTNAFFAELSAVLEQICRMSLTIRTLFHGYNFVANFLQAIG